MRQAGPAPPTPAPLRLHAGRPPPRAPTRTRSPRQARWLLLRPPETLDGDEAAYRAALLDACPDVETARDLIEGFGRLIRERDGAGLKPWLECATECGIAELREFAAGIRRDQAAVEAALTLEWSNERVAYCTSSPGWRPIVELGRAGPAEMTLPLLAVGRGASPDR